MASKRRSLWLYPLFQIPLIALGCLLLIALLFSLLGLGKPYVAVAIALDFSSSNASDTLVVREVDAVKAYAQKNAQVLRVPNQLQVYGFGREVVPLTSGFEADPQKLETQLAQALSNPALRQQIGLGQANLIRALEQTTVALSQVQNYCRQLLLVTDGRAALDPAAIASLPNAIATATAQKVRVNVVVVGADSLPLQALTLATGGTYLSGMPDNLATLLSDRLFASFNNNHRWIRFWLGLAWIALMWVFMLPFDRWILQGLMRLPMNLSGQLALANALFWTVVTPLMLWGIGLPFLSQCP